LGKTLDQIPNTITGKTTAAFEPSLDYVVVKLPQFQFSKFEVRHPWLGPSMKSIGEAMAIGRTFPEALVKGVRSMEEGFTGLALKGGRKPSKKELLEHIAKPNPYRLFYIKEALEQGMKPAAISKKTGIHLWFIEQIAQIPSKRETAEEPGFLDVDTCAGEFAAQTPYFYSSRLSSSTGPLKRTRGKKRFVILGSGPNRIGEGLEFDYSCVQASQAVQEAGHEAVLINSNPETVSTDYDVSTRLYFEPVELEEVEAVLRRERPDGVILQFGGQQPLNLADRLKANGWPVLGTPVDSIDRSEDRNAFADSLRRLRIPYPKYRLAPTPEDVLHTAHEVGFPVLVRPSFVMGGDRIRTFKDPETLEAWISRYKGEKTSFLVDRFLSQAVEVDIDAVSDGKDIVLCGMLEHIEPAGVHSGDSSMITPPPNLPHRTLQRIEGYIKRIAKDLKIKGICNLQVAVYKGTPYVIELNARSSRTVPFLSKAQGMPWAKVATRVQLGESLAQAIKRYKPRKKKRAGMFYAKSSAFCFYRFEGPPPPLGPEMRSTGETMGIATSPETALAKARLAAGQEPLGRSGRVYCLQDL